MASDAGNRRHARQHFNDVRAIDVRVERDEVVRRRAFVTHVEKRRGVEAPHRMGATDHADRNVIDEPKPDRRRHMRRPEPREVADRRVLDVERIGDPRLATEDHRACCSRPYLRAGKGEAVGDRAPLPGQKARLQAALVDVDDLLSGALGRHLRRLQEPHRDRPCVGAGIGPRRQFGRRRRLSGQRHVESPRRELDGADGELALMPVPDDLPRDPLDHHRLMVGLVQSEIALADFEGALGVVDDIIGRQREAHVDRKGRIRVEAGGAEASNERDFIDGQPANMGDKGARIAGFARGGRRREPAPRRSGRAKAETHGALGLGQDSAPRPCRR